jgi:hypothetical protein
MEGSIAVPMLVGERSLGVGVAKPLPSEFPEPEIKFLLEVGALIGKRCCESAS